MVFLTRFRQAQWVWLGKGRHHVPGKEAQGLHGGTIGYTLAGNNWRVYWPGPTPAAVTPQTAGLQPKNRDDFMI
jgi:hypothetical protein